MLVDKALLVNLRISMWQGRKFDRVITREVDQQHGTHDAGRYNKILVAKDEIKKIQKVASKMRVLHYEHTLPWSDSGDRILPTANFKQYANVMREQIDEFDTLVKDFVKNYPLLIDDARRRLNSMFNPLDYPHPDDIQYKFRAGFSFVPMPPEVDDFRLDLDQAEVDKIKADIKAEITDRHTQAVNDLFERAKEAVSRMVDTLKEKDKVFRNSLIGNIEKMIELFPALNYTNDPKLAKLTNELKSLVIDPDNLRSDSDLRETYLKRAQELNKKFF